MTSHGCRCSQLRLTRVYGDSHELYFSQIMCNNHTISVHIGYPKPLKQPLKPLYKFFRTVFIYNIFFKMPSINAFDLCVW